MAKFVCVDPEHRSAYRPVEVEAKNKTEARKIMCKKCIPVCSGPEKVPEMSPGQMPLF